MTIDYQKICGQIFQDLPTRKREVLEKRFGLRSQTPQTLQAIGDDFGITRERVRQIENDTIAWIRETQKPKLTKPFQYFLDYFDQYGGLRSETRLLDELGQERFQTHILLLLTLGEEFRKFKETEEFYPFWSAKPDSFGIAKAIIRNIIAEFRKIKTPLPIEELETRVTVETKTQVLTSYIDVSKLIFRSPFGSYGLAQWPEVNPRGLRDRAYLVLKRENTPLHFTQITELIGQLTPAPKLALPESVHNELIRNERFVLVGRGIYALREWGYEPGTVKEVLIDILKKSKNPLTKEELFRKVLGQRKVQENTILLNLQDKQIFQRDEKGKYNLHKN